MADHFQKFQDAYLETIYAFYETNKHLSIWTGDLAERFGVSPASTAEIIQRLSIKGFIDYVRYKRAQLTKKGLIHGRTMKQHHRLAEVLLEQIPFDGNAHETTCRLEHTINDDLEVVLAILLGKPQLDPSGKESPLANETVNARIRAGTDDYAVLTNLSKNDKGAIAGLLFSEELVDLFGNRLAIGSFVKALSSSQYEVETTTLEFIQEISDSIIV